MKHPFAEIRWTPKVYAIMGAIALVVICLIGVIVVSYVWISGTSVSMDFAHRAGTTAPPSAGKDIGKPGSVCSGPERYPCAPGTKCSVSDADWGTKYGTCITDPAGSKTTTPAQ